MIPYDQALWSARTSCSKKWGNAGFLVIRNEMPFGHFISFTLFKAQFTRGMDAVNKNDGYVMRFGRTRGIVVARAGECEDRSKLWFCVTLVAWLWQSSKKVVHIRYDGLSKFMEEWAQSSRRVAQSLLHPARRCMPDSKKKKRMATVLYSVRKAPTLEAEQKSVLWWLSTTPPVQPRRCLRFYAN